MTFSFATLKSSEASQLYEVSANAGGQGFLSGNSLKPREDFTDLIPQAPASSWELRHHVSPRVKQRQGTPWTCSQTASRAVFPPKDKLLNWSGAQFQFAYPL